MNGFNDFNFFFLQENVGLKHLNVCMNGFGLEGAKALEEALRQNHTLLSLNISYCRIPLEGAPHIASGLQHNDCLTHLNVCMKQSIDA